MSDTNTNPQLPPVYIVDGEGYDPDPLVIKVEVTEILNHPEGEVLTEYLHQLLQDMIGGCGFNMAVTKSREEVDQAREDVQQ